MAEQNEDTAVQDFLEILEEHRKNCERQGKYVEAEIAKNRLEELKLQELQIQELQKKISEDQAKLKYKQNLYEAVRSDRNLYSKQRCFA
jgi:uncharacterized sporulation protein YeaH/YhbH (DUF444 family)